MVLESDFCLPMVAAKTFQSPNTGVICNLAWNPRQDTLASSNSDGSILLWSEDRTSRELLRVGPGTNPCIAWHPSGLQLAVGKQHKLWLVNPVGSDAKLIESPYGAIQSLSWNQLGVLATAHDDGMIRLWDEEGKFQATIAAHKGAMGLNVAWHPNDRQLATGGEALLRVWDIQSAELVWIVAPSFHTFLKNPKHPFQE